MRTLIVLITLLSLVGCTSLHPIEGAPADLRERIASGHLLVPGARAVITTTDGHTHALLVSAVDDGRIVSAQETVPIDEVVAVKKREFSKTKTVVLGVVIGVAIVYGAAYLAFRHGGFSFSPGAPM